MSSHPLTFTSALTLHQEKRRLYFDENIDSTNTQPHKKQKVSIEAVNYIYFY